MFLRALITPFVAASTIWLSPVAFAQTNVPQGGTGVTSVSAGSFLVGSTALRLTSTSSPTVGVITSTSTTATSTFPRISLTSAVNLLGDYITNITTWVRG